MPEYDFSTLSPYDFETLTRDLLQREWGIRLESFKSGRDKGIDLRYSKPKEQSERIVQCKHYRKSGYSKLKSVLKNDELPKIEKLNPKRYVVASSVTLSPDQKEELVDILAPHCHGPADIFGSEDLNNLLGKHGEIERQHFKLWLPSTEVLLRLLHNGVFTQSAIEIDEIKRHLALFVPTAAVERSLDALTEYGFCMLTGIPGIGKTTTARILVAHHVHRNWEGIYLSSRSGEAFKVFSPNEKQIFFYDDFLGQTSLEEKLVKNEDKELQQLIKACRKNPKTKRLVLTTREYLFEQAKQQHEILSRSRIEVAECTVKLSDYTDKIRAAILVNHLYFYGVDSDVCTAFVSSGIARETLDHQNYNPRIVETMCEMQSDLALGPKDFGKHFLEMLDSPEAIWAHAYQHQLSTNARQLLLVFAILGSHVTVEALRNEFRIYAQETDIGEIGFDAMFERCLEELEGNFLAIHPHENLAYISYHNPSIQDFTDHELGQESRILRIVLNHFTYDEPLANAAKRLVECHAGVAASGAEILAAMQRSNWRRSFRVNDNRSTVTLERPLDRGQSLRSWIDVVSTLKDADTTERMLRHAESFIRESDAHGTWTLSFIELYNDYQRLADLTELYADVTATEFVAQFANHCWDPDEFTGLLELLEDQSDLDTLKKRLQARLSERGHDWLDSEIDSANSSEQMYDSIDTLTQALESIGLSENHLDLSDAHRRAEMLAEEEDEQAEAQQEDWDLQRYQEQIESKAIDDILDSLRW